MICIVRITACFKFQYFTHEINFNGLTGFIVEIIDFISIDNAYQHTLILRIR